MHVIHVIIRKIKSLTFAMLLVILKKHVWQGKTMANKVEDLSEEWFELNIRFALNIYYVKQLEWMLHDGGNTDIPWSPLPIGSSTSFSNLSRKKKVNLVSQTKHKNSLSNKSD